MTDGSTIAAIASGAVGLIGTAGGILVQLKASTGTVSQTLRSRATTAEADAEELRQELVEANDALVSARREVTRLRLLLADAGVDPGPADGHLPAPRPPTS